MTTSQNNEAARASGGEAIARGLEHELAQTRARENAQLVGALASGANAEPPVSSDGVTIPPAPPAQEAPAWPNDGEAAAPAAEGAPYAAAAAFATPDSSGVFASAAPGENSQVLTTTTLSPDGMTTTVVTTTTVTTTTTTTTTTRTYLTGELPPITQAQLGAPAAALSAPAVAPAAPAIVLPEVMPAPAAAPAPEAVPEAAPVAATASEPAAADATAATTTAAEPAATATSPSQAAATYEKPAAYRFAKRAFDIVFSAAALVLLSWFYAIVAVIVKADDPEGPVIFKQTRIGKDGQPFTLYKFRTMVVNAEELRASLVDKNERSGPVFKIHDDPRITRAGRFLRKTSIDELPQFLNVLRGEMSVVGPRPALPDEVATYNEIQRERLLVCPGITCYWQTQRNRDQIEFDEWVELDRAYIRDRSVWVDLKLIVKTVGVVLTAQGN